MLHENCKLLLKSLTNEINLLTMMLSLDLLLKKPYPKPTYIHVQMTFKGDVSSLLECIYARLCLLDGHVWFELGLTPHQHRKVIRRRGPRFKVSYELFHPIKSDDEEKNSNLCHT